MTKAVIDPYTSRMLVYDHMPYKTGRWGEQAKERNKRRLAYFRAYHRKNSPPPKVFRLGEFGELLAKRKMVGSKLVRQTTHDLYWNGQLIEVKTSQHQSGNRYSFDIRIQKGKTDYFFALILNNRKELRHAYLIPDKAISAQVTLSITPGKSKYDRFRLELGRNHD